jgi:hypothetical protein
MQELNVVSRTAINMDTGNSETNWSIQEGPTYTYKTSWHFTLKMEAAKSSETLVSCHIIIRCHKPKHRREEPYYFNTAGYF